MDHLESIVEIKNIVHSDFIEKIIPLIDKKATKHSYSLTLSIPTDLFYWNFIKKEIERLYLFYKTKFPMLKNNKISQIDLLKSTLGRKYDLHTDLNRSLSIIINLNDNYKGGDLVFTDQKAKEIKRLKLGKGSIVFFPSNFMYPYKIEPITKGTRYSIVAWLQ
jgi:predicted 2-oxoglutarate/Fe(II)-dependent dioxygenase YbiX